MVVIYLGVVSVLCRIVPCVLGTALSTTGWRHSLYSVVEVFVSEAVLVWTEDGCPLIFGDDVQTKQLSN